MLAGLQSGAAMAEIFAAPEAGGPRYLQVIELAGGLNMREAPLGAVVQLLPTGARLVNLGGCLMAKGRAWCDVQPLGGGARGVVAQDFVRPAAGPNGDVGMGPDDSVERAGAGQFNATTEIACAKGEGAPMGACPAGVARGTGGDATVVVTLPGGAKRLIYFMAGEAVGADGSQADGMAGAAFSVTRASDQSLITYGDERYEIVDALPFGG